jgi:hypothetical protein
VKKACLTVLTAAALALAVSSGASADPLSSPGCFGQGVSQLAQTGAVGGLVSGIATNPNSVPYGQTTVPAFKSLACGT